MKRKRFAIEIEINPSYQNCEEIAQQVVAVIRREANSVGINFRLLKLFDSTEEPAPLRTWTAEMRYHPKLGKPFISVLELAFRQLNRQQVYVHVTVEYRALQISNGPEPGWVQDAYNELDF